MHTVAHALEPLLVATWGPFGARSVMKTLPTSAGLPAGDVDVVDAREILACVEAGQRLFGTPSKPLPLSDARRAITGGGLAKPRVHRILIRTDADVLVVQRTSQQLTRGFFSVTDGVRLATAASELGRNIYMYAKHGTLMLSLCEESAAYRFDVVADDEGPGISNLEQVLSGRYVSRTGLGRGLVGTKALLDELIIDSAPGRGTHVKGLRRVRKP
ncbi:MAG: hypothetical protein JNG84_11450 [Archangium sp.]|nr:hypothetical protein [Archangium sp.]